MTADAKVRKAQNATRSQGGTCRGGNNPKIKETTPKYAGYGNKGK